MNNSIGLENLTPKIIFLFFSTIYNTAMFYVISMVRLPFELPCDLFHYNVLSGEPKGDGVAGGGGGDD